MMRDNIKLYQNFSSFSHRCPLCSKSDHFFNNCPKLHHIPNRNFLFSRLNHFQFQPRDKNPNFRKLKKSNFRCFSQMNMKINEENNLLELKEEKQEEIIVSRNISGDSFQEGFSSMEFPQETQNLYLVFIFF